MLKQLLRDLGLTAIALTIGALIADKELTNYYTSEIKSKVEQQKIISYQEGYQAGRYSLNGKSLALQDPRLSSKVCKAWWFDLTATERNVH